MLQYLPHTFGIINDEVRHIFEIDFRAYTHNRQMKETPVKSHKAVPVCKITDCSSQNDKTVEKVLMDKIIDRVSRMVVGFWRIKRSAAETNEVYVLVFCFITESLKNFCLVIFHKKIKQKTNRDSV
jgi:hypothetical protein